MPNGVPTMGEPQPNYDPVAVILARVETKLDNALTEQARHGTQLDRHDALLDRHGNRLTALETKVAPLPAAVEALEGRRSVSPAALAWAWGTAVAALAVLVTFLAAYVH